MECDVTVQIDGEDVPVGRLYQSVRNGTETATFSYTTSYLERDDAFAIAPDMPLGAGTFHSVGLGGFRALEDCMPDRWGRNLLLRAERQSAREEGRAPRTLFETDLLVGVNDETRQGALRVWGAGHLPLASVADGVPREVGIPALLDAADHAAEDIDADVRDLVAAGSSLGGARPKASVRDGSGRLWVAKFPRPDEGSLEDVGAWERACLQLMSSCGISVPESRLLRIAGRSVLLTLRFDRRGTRRVPYISGLTAVQGADGGRYSYLELAEFIEEESADPTRDLRELWRRALFSCAVGNTDNHLRNHGFLRARGGWLLAPAFDVNPTPGDEPKYLATGLDYDAREADPRVALDVCEFFRLDAAEARHAALSMAGVLDGWRRVAAANGISGTSADRMARCLDAGAARLRAVGA